MLRTYSSKIRRHLYFHTFLVLLGLIGGGSYLLSELPAELARDAVVSRGDAQTMAETAVSQLMPVGAGHVHVTGLEYDRVAHEFIATFAGTSTDAYRSQTQVPILEYRIDASTDQQDLTVFIDARSGRFTGFVADPPLPLQTTPARFLAEHFAVATATLQQTHIPSDLRPVTEQHGATPPPQPAWQVPAADPTPFSEAPVPRMNAGKNRPSSATTNDTTSTYLSQATSSIASPHGTGTTGYIFASTRDSVTSVRHGFTWPESYLAQYEQPSLWKSVLTLLTTVAAFGLPLFALIVTGRRLFARTPLTALAWCLGAGLITLFLAAQLIGAWPYPPDSPPLFILLSTFILAVVGFILYGLPSIGAVLARAEVAAHYQTADALWVRLRTLITPEELARTVTYAYLFTVAGVLLIIGTELIIPSFDDFTPIPPLIRLLMLAEYPVLYVATSFVLLPAISEELLYRFFAVRIFAARLHSVIAGATFSSILFALGHLDPATGGATVFNSAIFFTLGGLGLAYIYLRHGIFTAVLTHAIYNATLGCITLIGLYPHDPRILVLTGLLVLAPALASLGNAIGQAGRGVGPRVTAE